MFLIQSLHPDGQWVDEGVVQLEYWAYQDAQRCHSVELNFGPGPMRGGGELWDLTILQGV